MANAQNRYQSQVGGILASSHHAMAGVTKPKVLLVRQVMHLSYATLAQTFNMVGKAQLDGIRHAMIEDISRWPGPMCSWRESASRLIGESSHGNLI